MKMFQVKIGQDTIRFESQKAAERFINNGLFHNSIKFDSLKCDECCNSCGGLEFGKWFYNNGCIALSDETSNDNDEYYSDGNGCITLLEGSVL